MCRSDNLESKNARAETRRSITRADAGQSSHEDQATQSSHKAAQSSHEPLGLPMQPNKDCSDDTDSVDSN